MKLLGGNIIVFVNMVINFLNIIIVASLRILLLFEWQRECLRN